MSTEPPIPTGWLVSYKSRKGRVPGSKDGWTTATVVGCRWAGNYWRILLSNRDRPTLSEIINIGEIGEDGEIVWTGPPA